MKNVAQGTRAFGWILRLTASAVLLPTLVWAQVAWAQVEPLEGEFIYHAQLHDTLIGISRRLLLEPRRWPEIQTRNKIADPRHIPLGNQIRIPYAWLRLDANTATVMAVSGDVSEGGRTVTRGQTLPEGSRIQTGADGSATLLLADGSVLTLQKSSVLTLHEMRKVTGVEAAHSTRLRLDSGRLQTRVTPHGNVGRFEIRTPVAVSAVRGTEFRDAFEPEAGAATTETLDGAVAVAGSGAELTIPADFGTRVEHDAPPIPPVRLLPAPDLQSIPATLGATRLQLGWPAVAQAPRYRLQLAPNPQFQSFILDAELDQPQLDVPAPADGHYWLRVRAIDRLGLEGHDAVRELEQHFVPPPPPPPRPPSPTPIATLSDHRIQLHWSEQEGMHYRVQIARDSGFGTPVVDQTLDTLTLSTRRLLAGTYYARVATIAADGSAAPFSEPVQIKVPVPLWMKILLPVLAVIAIVR